MSDLAAVRQAGWPKHASKVDGVVRGIGDSPTLVIRAGAAAPLGAPAYLPVALEKMWPQSRAQEGWPDAAL